MKVSQKRFKLSAAGILMTSRDLSPNLIEILLEDSVHRVGVESRPFGGYVVAGAELPTTDIQDSSGRVIAVVYGYFVDIRSASFVPKVILLDDDSGQGIEYEIHCVLKGLAGRFFCIAVVDRETRLYPDASGSFSLLADFETGRICSDLACWKDLKRRDKHIANYIDGTRSQSGTWYPFGFTPYHDIRVLLPSAYYLLPSLKSCRYWPSPNLHEGGADSAYSIEMIAKNTRSTMHAFMNRMPCAMNITAGKDSRMLLAMIKERRAEVLFLTDRDHSAIDTKFAPVIAKACLLNHEWTQKDRFYDRCLMQGLAGEVGRAFYWREADLGRSADELIETFLSRVGFPSDPPPLLIDAYESWSETLCNHLGRPAATLFYDVAYIEQRLACAMGPAMYAHEKSFTLALYPLNCHDIFEMMLGLDPDFRYRQGMAHVVISTCWPELNSFPMSHITTPMKYRAIISYLMRQSPHFKEFEYYQALYLDGQSFMKHMFDDAVRLPFVVARRLARRS